MQKKKTKEEKATWDNIYKDFRRRHPNLRKDVIHHEPYSYATIKLVLKDGKKMIYNYDTKMAKFINE